VSGKKKVGTSRKRENTPTKIGLCEELGPSEVVGTLGEKKKKKEGIPFYERKNRPEWITKKEGVVKEERGSKRQKPLSSDNSLEKLGVEKGGKRGTYVCQEKERVFV